ncbi:MAG: hypothetical protein KTR23_03235 [Rhodospirillales bacterium]|nr:hypothetical protein [Rhodospirillales bacterium]
MTKSPVPLKQQIQAHIASGTVFPLDYATLAKNAEYVDAAVIPVNINFEPTPPAAGQGLGSFNKISGLLGGNMMSTIVPNGILPSADIALTEVGFLLGTADKSVIQVSCALGFYTNGAAGLSWDIADIDGKKLTLVLDTIDFAWTMPGEESESIFGSVNGTTTIGGFTLDVSLTFPGIILELSLPKGSALDISDFFSHFGFGVFTFPTDLYLTRLDFTAAPGDSSFDINALIETGDGGPLSLIPDLLSVDELSFAFSHAPGSTQGSIGAQLICLQYLVLNVSAEMDTVSQSWQFSGFIDIPATWTLRNKARQTPKSTPTTYEVSLSDLGFIFAPNDYQNIPSAIGDFSIAALGISYSYSSAGDGNGEFTFSGVFEDQWSLDGETINADMTLTFDRRKKQDGSGHETSGSVAADFVMDGFNFSLGYTFGISTEYTAKISCPQFEIDGTYTENAAPAKGGTATLSFGSGDNLGDLLSWFVGEAADNPYFTLPYPWSSVFSAISLDGVSLKIDTGTKEVSCTYAPDKPIDFLGVSLSAVTIDYQPARKTTGGSGIKITPTGTIFGETIPSWDPAQERPPTVPGKAPVFDLKLLAAGQHLAFNTTSSKFQPPNNYKALSSVDNIVYDLGKALQSAAQGKFHPEILEFNKSAGWLLGAHVQFLGQVDVQFVFNDPQLYGLALKVTKSTKNGSKKLDVLAGLEAEILYRKVSPTIGEYSGEITLPSDIRRFEYGAVSLTLPSFSMAVYTNGDFSFNVGFPKNLDFSHSFSLSAGEFSGAGGFYYKKLNGLHPASLPTVEKDTNGNPVGDFNPITEIGIGIRAGLGRSFHSGPLSASLSILLEGLFQGTFAEYRQLVADSAGHAPGYKDEYYDIRATVAITGHLTGEINFFIITASVQVKVIIRADMDIVAYQDIPVDLSAGVSVAITVGINCGFFTIHIHCHFSTTIHEHIVLGQTTTAPWQIPAFTGYDSQLEGPEEETASAKEISSPPIYRPVQNTAPLTVHLLPQATYSNYPGTDTPSWWYVGQFGMTAPGTAGSDSSFTNLISGVVRWALASIGNTSHTAISQKTADTITLSKAQIEVFVQQLQQMAASPTSGPSIDDLIGLYSESFKISYVATASAGQKFSFFPILPGLEIISFSCGKDDVLDVVDESPLLTKAIERVLLEAESTDNPMHMTPLGALDDTSFHSQFSCQTILLKEYTMLLVQSALHTAIKSTKIFGSNENLTIGEIISGLEALDGEYASLAGMATRFLLNGKRVINGDGVAVPLYRQTAQQIQISLKQTHTGMVVVGYSGNVNAWGLASIYEQKDISAVVYSASKDKSSLMLPTAWMEGKVDSSSSSFTFTDMPNAVVQDQHFQLKLGATVQQKSVGTPKTQESLWHFPPALERAVTSIGAPLSSFAVYQYESDPDRPGRVKNGKALSAAPDWALCVDFKVKRISLPAAVGQKAGHLADTYQIVNVNKTGLLQLHALITDIDSGGGTGSTSVSKIDIAWLNGASVELSAIDRTTTIMAQNDFPTSAQGGATVGLDPIYKLWRYGISTTTSTYLYHGTGLPASLFGSDGTATVTMVIRFVGTTPPAYANAVLTTRPIDQAGKRDLYVVAPGELTTIDATVSQGKTGIRVTRPVPTTPAAPTSFLPTTMPPVTLPSNTQHTLDNLFTILSGSVTSIGGAAPSDSKVHPISPKDDANNFVYDHIFTLVPAYAPPTKASETQPPAANNPYQFMGQTIDFDLLPTDLFGNQWGPISGTSLTARYTDPVFSLKQLPYLNLDYMISGTGTQAQLGIAFHWTAPDYGTYTPDQKARDLTAYAMAIYQLEAKSIDDPGLVATIATSLLGGSANASNIGTVDILDNLKAIYKAIVTSAASPTLKIINVSVSSDDGNFNSQIIYPLTVTLTLKRQGPIDPAFKDDPKVLQSTVSISPQAVGTTSSQKSLRPFAEAFKAAYAAQGLLIAVGPLFKHGADPQDHQVWVVNYGKGGIDISFPPSTPSYFAPKPLSNQLQSRSNITYTGLDGTKQTVSVTNVDLDAVMKQFMAAVDAFATPELCIPATRINSQAVDDINNAKLKIIGNLLTYVTNLVDGTSYDPTNDSGTAIAVAAAKYREACLVQLGNFYKMASVVAIDVKNAGTDPASTVNIQGIPQISGASGTTSSNEFSLTSGHAPISTSGSTITFGLYPKQIRDYEYYGASLDFQLEAIEHGLDTVIINGETYNVGSWLRFVIDPGDIQVGKVDIPIPLRTFPTSPHLTKQYAEDLGISSANQDQLLRSTKSWSLNCDFSHKYAAQDEVFVSVDTSQSTGTHCDIDTELSSGKAGDLLDALIEFQAIYPSLRSDFNLMRAGHTTGVSAALTTFATLVAKVASSSWSIKSTGNQTNQTNAATSDTLAVTLWEGAKTTGSNPTPTDTDPWVAKISVCGEQNTMGVFPTISIPGYSTLPQSMPSDFSGNAMTYTFEDADGNPLLAKDAWAIREHTLVVEPVGYQYGVSPKTTTVNPFNILDWQFGNTTIMVKRNADLPSPFHYQTPIVAYKAPVKPYLETSIKINMAGLGTDDGLPGPRHLSSHLLAFFQALLASSASVPGSGRFQMVTSFEFPSNPNVAGLKPIQLPISFRLPTQVVFQSPVQATNYITEIESVIVGWLNENNLNNTDRPDLWGTGSTAVLRFEVTIFGGTSETASPILRLSNIVLPAAMVQW